MDQYLSDVYRTRLYAPMFLVLILYLFVPRFRGLFQNLAQKTDKTGAVRISVLAALVALAFSVALLYPGKSWGGDFSQYLAQSRAIATGTLDEWYEKNSFIIDHSYEGLGADVYPWMYSLIVLPLYLLTNDFSYPVLKILSVLFFSGAVFFMTQLFCRKVRHSVALFAALFISVNLSYAFSNNACDADVPVIFFTMLALNMTDLHLNREEEGKSGLWVAFLSGLSIFLAVQTKTLAMALLLALPVCDVMRLRRIPAGKADRTAYFCRHAVPYVTYAVCSGLIDLTLPRAGGTYRGYFALSPEVVKRGMDFYFDATAGFFGGDVRPIIHAISIVLAVIVLILSLAGMVRNFRRDDHLIVYTCGSVVMLLLYDFYRANFIYSLFPVILMEALSAGDHLLSRIDGEQHFVRNLFTGAALIDLTMCAVASLTISGAIHFKGFHINEAATEDAMDMYAYVREHLPEDSVVWFFKPRVLYYYTGVYSYIQDDNPANLEEAGYAIVDSGQEGSPVYQALSGGDSFEEIYRNDTWLIYARR